MDINSAVGRKAGLSEQQLLELGQYESIDAFDDLERLILRYATLMSQAHVDVADELIEALKKQLSAAQLVELTSAIAWENYRARFNRAFDVQAAGFTEGAVCALPVRPN